MGGNYSASAKILNISQGLVDRMKCVPGNARLRATW
jgi:hypothetical protein